ncbi:MAG: hypothetical protein FWD57_11255 [Polyangiaceae bacterium]|nr:hypothetical protein [Polyangiaceae bacterium]
MIPVTYQDEPKHPEFNFDLKVRQRGKDWLNAKNIPLDGPLPKRMRPPRYWAACLHILHHKYGGICAYLSVRIDHSPTIDHYVPKSKLAGLAYEWSNYRLACAEMNQNKADFTTVLDPFELVAGTFHLDLLHGLVIVNPEIQGETRDNAQATIDCLDLNNERFRKMRVRIFDTYINQSINTAPPQQSARDALKDESPFVFLEAERQELL